MRTLIAALLLLPFALDAHAASKEEVLAEVSAAIGATVELSSFGQYTNGEKIRNSFNTKSGWIVLAKETFYVVATGPGPTRIRAYVTCAGIKNVEIKELHKDTVILDVLGDGAVHRFRVWRGEADDAEALIERFRACAQ